jgi:hypothetical protein
MAKFLNATTVREVTDFLIESHEDDRVRRRPVGKRDNNFATMNLGSDPAAGVVERITNAVDAVIELQWVKRGEPSALRSPRSAVDESWGIPEGRMSNIQDLRTPARDSSAATVTRRRDRAGPPSPVCYPRAATTTALRRTTGPGSCRWR